MANLGRFDPRTYAGLHAWYDANWVNGFGAAPPADGAAIAQWNDLSGNGRHLLQGTGANQPLFRLTGALNQLPCVETVDNTDVMSAPVAGAGTRPYMVIAVFANKLADDGAYHRGVLVNNGGVGVGIQWAGSVDSFGANDSGSVNAGTIAGDLNVWHIDSYIARTTGFTSEVAIDGVTTGFSGVAGTDTDRTIGLSLSGAGGFLGLYGEIIVFMGELSRPHRNALESSLVEKWGFLPRYGLRG